MPPFGVLQITYFAGHCGHGADARSRRVVRASRVLDDPMAVLPPQVGRLWSTLRVSS